MKSDIEDHIKEIRAALAREDARSKPTTNTKPSPSDILIAAREMMKRVKGELKDKIPELKPIEGINAALIELHNQGYHLGIITSNSQENVNQFLKCHSLDYLFDFIYSGVTIFGKTTIINNVLRQKQFKSEAVIYVGDETRDVESAKKANIKV